MSSISSYKPITKQNIKKYKDSCSLVSWSLNVGCMNHTATHFSNLIEAWAKNTKEDPFNLVKLN